MLVDARHACRRPVSSRLGVAVRAIVALCAALTVAVPAAASASPAAVAQTPASVQNAKLRIVLRTTSDWASLRLSPGRVVAARTVSVTPGAHLAEVTGGWKLRGAVGPARAVVEAFFRDAEGSDTFAVELAKGYDGVASVSVVNQNDRPFHVVDMTNDRHTSDRNLVTRSRPRRGVFGEVPLRLPFADARPLVLAFYYPWYDRYGDDPRFADEPADPRRTSVAADVRSMTEQAATHGIDGFVVSWAGDDANGSGFDLAMRAAERTGQRITGYLEVGRAAAATGPDELVATRVRRWLGQLLDRASSPAFLRAGGEPVVFVYRMALLPPVAWRTILEDLARNGTPVRLVGDTDSDTYADVSWGMHQFTALGSLTERRRYATETAARARAEAVVDPTAHPRLFAATVAPGYDDRGVRDGNPVVPRGSRGERYTATWDAALAGQPDWILVNSWNEWFEGTAVEPGVEAGDRALRQTDRRADAWKTTQDDRLVDAVPGSRGLVDRLRAIVGPVLHLLAVLVPRL